MKIPALFTSVFVIFSAPRSLILLYDVCCHRLAPGPVASIAMHFAQIKRNLHIFAKDRNGIRGRKNTYRRTRTAHCSKSSFFVQKFNFDLPKKIVELFWVTRENAAVLDFLAIDNFDFTRKIFGRKTRQNVGDLNFLVVDNFDFPRKIVKFCQN